MLIPFITQVLDAIMPIVTVLIEKLLPPLLDIIEAVLPSLMVVIQALLPVLQPILDIFVLLIDQIIVPLIPLIEWLATVISETLASAFSGITPIIDGLKTYLGGIITFITGIFSGDWDKAWDGIVQVFSGWWDTVTAIFKFPINVMIDGINKFIDFLNTIKIPDWVPGVGGKGLHFTKMTKLMIGLDYVPMDNYPALLHKGERVLTAEENKNGSGSFKFDYDKMAEANLRIFKHFGIVYKDEVIGTLIDLSVTEALEGV